MSRPKRTQFFVDSEVQGAIVRRVIVYWTCCLLFLVVPLCIATVVQNPELFFFEQFGRLWSQYWLILVSLVAMLPFFIYDTVRLSNRFAGPLLRFRRELRRLADGEQVAPLQFREDDFWRPLADEFNRLAARLAADEAPASSPAEPTEHESELQPLGSTGESGSSS